MSLRWRVRTRQVSKTLLWLAPILRELGAEVLILAEIQDGWQITRYVDRNWYRPAVEVHMTPYLPDQRLVAIFVPPLQ